MIPCFKTIDYFFLIELDFYGERWIEAASFQEHALEA